jgi:hypothetical protein
VRDEKTDLKQELSTLGQKVKDFLSKRPEVNRGRSAGRRRTESGTEPAVPRFADEEAVEPMAAEPRERESAYDDAPAARRAPRRDAARRKTAKKGGGLRLPSFFRAPRPAARRPKRNGRVVVPVFLQTTIAVFVCCGVLAAAGFALFTVEQYEIAGLKADLKTYADAGVVPADSLEDSLALNVEALAGRVAALEKISASGGASLGGEDLQWLGAELTAVQEEARKMDQILNDVDAADNVRAAFKDKIQSPLVTLQQNYDSLGISDEDVASTSVETGAATNTGEFKLANALRRGIRWTLLILAVLAVLVLICLALRRRFGGSLAAALRERPQKAAKAKKQRPRRPAAAKGKKRQRPAAKETVKPAAPAAAAADAPEAAAEAESAEPAGSGPPRAGDEDESNADAEAAAAAAAEAAKKEETDFYENLAPSLKKMAETERANAAEGAAMPSPAEEDLLSFDASVESLGSIDSDDDDLFLADGGDEA